MFDIGKKITDDIAQYGWTALHVFGTEDQPQVSFTYTIGLTQRGLPEIIVFGLSGTVAHGLIVQAIKHHSDELSNENKLNNVIAGFPAWIRPVDSERASHDYAIQAARYYGRDVAVVQLIWPDQQGRFPWDIGVHPEMAAAQSELTKWNNPLH